MCQGFQMYQKSTQRNSFNYTNTMLLKTDFDVFMGTLEMMCTQLDREYNYSVEQWRLWFCAGKPLASVF